MVEATPEGKLIEGGVGGDKVVRGFEGGVESSVKKPFFLPALCLSAKQGPLPALAKAVMSLFHVGCESARLCLAGTQTELKPINTKCSV